MPGEECEPAEHVWVFSKYGSGISKDVSLHFCVRCDREEWANGIVIPGWSRNYLLVDFDD